MYHHRLQQSLFLCVAGSELNCVFLDVRSGRVEHFILTLSPAFGFLSGWYSFASFLYAYNKSQAYFIPLIGEYKYINTIYP